MRHWVISLPNRRLTRRSALGAGAAVSAATVLAACGPQTAGTSASQPTAASANVKTLLWRPWYNFSGATSKTGSQLIHDGIRPFLDQNPGVEINISFMGYHQTTATAIIAGTGPDVFEDWILPPFTETGLVVNLEPYIRRDNVDLSIYPSGQMSFFKEAGGFAPSGAGIYCLPAYLHTAVQAVNLSILDEVGLAYPEAGWDHLQWTQLWKSLTVKAGGGKQQRYGTTLYWAGYDSAGNNPADFYWWGFGGEFVNPSDATKSFLSSSGSLAFANWCYPLLQAGVMGHSGNIANGRAACAPLGSAGDMISAAHYTGFKWDFYPWPKWPAHQTSYSASDFYAISSATKDVELAWSFLKFLCVDKTWQRYMVQLALAGPNQKPLWAEYAQSVQAAAPPLKNKNLKVLADSVLNDEPYRGLVFHYQDTQSASVIAKYSLAAQAGTQSVEGAFATATTQLDAIQAQGAATQAQMSTLRSRFPTQGPRMAAAPTGI